MDKYQGVLCNVSIPKCKVSFSGSKRRSVVPRTGVENTRFGAVTE
eukprot:CAMPEP_0117769604 /NCGR_PEP_ID=MMETSP0947-20121206/23162_1 /TAXON_ID=44440 /ORGANISM="Chattonella subsalsa, Strain CCMP2191" /LENGTH=44 /DNA_ID= /DNA_START= /DNA_END= /DNA_ORIENTATION=